jgi:hypothetical protein
MEKKDLLYETSGLEKNRDYLRCGWHGIHADMQLGSDCGDVHSSREHHRANSTRAA